MALNIPKKQHILPARSITRFYGSRRSVDIFNLRANKRHLGNATNDVFTFSRAWDSNVEVITRRLESNFQKLADTLNDERILTNPQNETVSRFYALLKSRSIAHVEIPSTPLFDPTSINYSQEDEASREEGELEGRFSVTALDDINRLALGMAIRLHAARPPLIAWKTMHAIHHEFVVTDNYRDVTMIPLTPSLCLVPTHQSALANRQQTKEYNKWLVRHSRRWYFARDLDATGAFEFAD